MSPSLPVPRAVKFVATCLVITVCVGGCTSMRSVGAVSAPSPPREYTDIRPGDRVAVEMKDGRRESFEVQIVDGDMLVSPSGQRYARTEMLRLERKRFSHAKTWPLVAGCVVGGFFVLAILALASWDGPVLGA